MANPINLALSRFEVNPTYPEKDKVTFVDNLNELIEATGRSQYVDCRARIGNSGAEKLAQTLENNKTLKSLYLKWSGISDKGTKYLVKAFHYNQTLEVLQLIESNIKRAEYLASSLKVSSVFLKVLNLEGNKLGDIGAENIAGALKENKSLIALCLAKNQISKVGARHIADALNVNQTLQNLDLRANNIRDLGCQFLAKALRVDNNNTSSSLLILCLDSNDIGNAGAGYLAEALKDNKSLTSLSLQGGPETVIESFGANKLAEGLALNYSLTQLDYRNLNLIPVDVDNSIQKLLRRNYEKKKSSFFETLKSNNKIPWNRARLMFVGQGRAGKTATVRSLLGQPFNPNWDSTIGATVSDGEVSNSPSWTEVSKGKVDHASTFAARIMNQEIMKQRIKDVATSGVRENGSIMSYAKNIQRRISRNRNSRNRARKILVDIEEASKRREEDNKGSSSAAHPEEESVREYDEKLVLNAGADTMNVTLWDFGGQIVFYSMHHIFLTKSGVYILAFSMCEFISSQLKALEYVSFWLNSIKLHAPAAPVVVVGTFLNDLDNSKDINFINVALNDTIEMITSQVVRNEDEDLVFFPIDNKTGEGVNTLRIKIEQVVRGNPDVDIKVSMKWILLLDKVLSKRQSNAYLSLDEVQAVANDVGISTSKELEMALSLFHGRGMLIHLTATEILKSTIIIDPQWLIDCLSKVIRDVELHLDKNGFQQAGLEDDLNSLINYGLASRDILEYVWEQEQIPFLLDLMERTLLLSKWKFKQELTYLIPSLVKGSFDGELFGSRCTFDFSRSFLPFGVFQRLICLTIGRISLSKERDERYEPKEPLIYKNFALVEFQAGNKLQIHEDVKAKQISVYIENGDFASRCLEIVLKMLQKLNCDVMGTGLQWETLLENPTTGELISYNEAREQTLAPWFRGGDSSSPTVQPTSVSGVNLEQFFDEIVL